MYTVEGINGPVMYAVLINIIGLSKGRLRNEKKRQMKVGLNVKAKS